MKMGWNSVGLLSLFAVVTMGIGIHELRREGMKKTCRREDEGTKQGHIGSLPASVKVLLELGL